MAYSIKIISESFTKNVLFPRRLKDYYLSAVNGNFADVFYKLNNYHNNNITIRCLDSNHNFIVPLFLTNFVYCTTSFNVSVDVNSNSTSIYFFNEF